MHPRFLSAVFFILGAFGTFIFFASHNVVQPAQSATPVAVFSRLASTRGVVLGEQTVVPSVVSFSKQSSVVSHRSTVRASVAEKPLETNCKKETTLIIHDGARAVTETVLPNSIDHNAFVRVIKSDERGVTENKGWRKVTLLRETQSFTSDRKSISQLHKPATFTFTYSKERLGNVKEDSLTVFYFNPTLRRWVGTRTSVDTSHHTVTAVFATQNVRFAVFGKP